MKILSNLRRAPTPQKPSETPKPHVTRQTLAETMDTLACVLRIFGRMSFDTEELPAGAHENQCERWARHVLIGTPAIAGECEAHTGADDGQAPVRVEVSPNSVTRPNAGGASVTATGVGFRRSWADLLRFVRERRDAEVRFVRTRLGGLRETLVTIIRGLRRAAMEDEQVDGEILETLSAIEAALATNSLTEVQRAVPKALEMIRGSLHRRRKTVRERLNHLGSTVATLREDLVETKRVAELDPLTELYNRGAFNRAFEQSIALSIARQEPLVLVMIDLDHFKRINDTYGHPVGDVVLRHAADTIVRTFPRRDDIVARYGGEEFSVVLRDVDAETATGLLDRLLQNFRSQRAHTSDGTAISVTASVGFAELGPNDTAETFLNRADQALLAAKAQGRNRAVFGRLQPD